MIGPLQVLPPTSLWRTLWSNALVLLGVVIYLATLQAHRHLSSADKASQPWTCRCRPCRAFRLIAPS